MDVIIGLIAVSLAIAIGFLILFLWNLKSGQYDDTITPSIRILFDEHKPDQPKPLKSDKNQLGS
jgi:cbb3-type cytochrome oxidase maturation protein